MLHHNDGEDADTGQDGIGPEKVFMRTPEGVNVS